MISAAHVDFCVFDPRYSYTGHKTIVWSSRRIHAVVARCRHKGFGVHDGRWSSLNDPKHGCVPLSTPDQVSPPSHESFRQLANLFWPRGAGHRGARRPRSAGTGHDCVGQHPIDLARSRRFAVVAHRRGKLHQTAQDCPNDATLRVWSGAASVSAQSADEMSMAAPTSPSWSTRRIRRQRRCGQGMACLETPCRGSATAT